MQFGQCCFPLLLTILDFDYIVNDGSYYLLIIINEYSTTFSVFNFKLIDFFNLSLIFSIYLLNKTIIFTELQLPYLIYKVLKYHFKVEF